MKIRKVILALSLVMLAVLFGGCGDSKQNTTTKPESAMQKNSDVSKQKEGDLDEKIVKKLISIWGSKDIAKRQSICPVSKLPVAKLLTTRLINGEKLIERNIQEPFEYKDIKVSNVRQNGNFGTAHVSFVDGTLHMSEESGFIKIDGKWYMNLSTITSVSKMNLSGYDKRMLDIDANIGYGFDKEYLIVMDVRAKTDKLYSAGWVEPITAVLITDKGEYPLQNFGNFFAPDSPLKISSKEPVRIALPFKGATGTPKALRLKGFNELDSRGLPANGDVAQVMNVSLN